MAKWLQWLEKAAGGGTSGNKRVNTFRWLLIIGLLGVMLMILNSFLSVEQVDINDRTPTAHEPSQESFVSKTADERSAFKIYETYYESALKDILEKIVGVDEAEVLVTIDSTEEILVQENRRETSQITNEKDQGGASRHITDITRSGEVVLYQKSGGQSPIVTKQINPKIRGVVVVARGAENIVVKKMITEAVSRGLDVPSHRISVLPRKHS